MSRAGLAAGLVLPGARPQSCPWGLLASCHMPPRAALVGQVSGFDSCANNLSMTS